MMRADERTDKRRRSSRPKTRAGAPRGARLELRVDVDERNAWIRAANRAGYLGVSDWIRDRLNKAAALGVRTSTQRDDWCTPDDVLETIRAAWGRVYLDPCSNERSRVHAVVELQLRGRGQNGLIGNEWIGFYSPRGDYRSDGSRGQRGLAFVNPPFGRELPAWIARCAEQHERHGIEILALVPARVDTIWWDRALRTAKHVTWPGRVSFVGADGEQPFTAPFPIAFLWWGVEARSWLRFRALVAERAAARARRASSARTAGRAPPG